MKEAGHYIFYLILIFFLVIMPSTAQEKPEVFLQTGDDYCKKNRLDLADEEYQKALACYIKTNNTQGMGLCYIKLGQVNCLLGFYDNSLDCYNNAIDLLKLLPEQNFSGEALIGRGEIYLLLKNYDESLKSYMEAMAVYEKSGNKTGKAAVLEHMGDVYNEADSCERALKYYNDSLNYFIEVNDIQRIAVVLTKIGENYFISGKDDTGLERLQEGLDIARNDQSISYDVLMRTSGICRKFGKYDRAIAGYKEARKLAREAGDKNNEIKAVLGMARTNLLKGSDELALSGFEDVKKLSEEGGDKGVRTEAIFNMAEIYYKYNRSDQSIQLYNESMQFYETVGDKWGLIQTCQKLGDIYEKQGHMDLAGQNYIESIKQLEELRGEIKLEEFKESFSEKAMPMYRKVINFFLKSGNGHEAFNYLEMARSRALLDALTGGKANIKQGANPLLLEKDKKLQAELNYIQKTLVKEKSFKVLDNECINELEIKWEKLSQELKSVKQELILSSPSYAFLTGIKKPLTVEEIQNKVLREKQFILEYLINKDNLIIWVISKDKFSFVEVPVSEKELTKKIDDFRKPFKALRDNPGGLFEIMPGLSSQNLNDLYNILFKPVSENIPENSELIIVPDGSLYSLPFETLVVERKESCDKNEVLFSDFSDNKYLIQNYNISYSPSASALDPGLLYQKKKNPGLYIGFGNPDFGTGAASKTTGNSQIQAGSQNNGDISSSILLFQGGMDDYLPPLPDTEPQVKNIEQLFKKQGKTEIYLRANATEEKFRSKCSNYKYILLATHGLMDENDPMQSRLVFTLTSKSSDDGFLRASEILNMNINAELVVLSACETGLGQIKTGEGVIGLTRAFMYAGTPSIVVSLWNVESKSTAGLIERFYKKLLSGMNKAEALRQAKLEIMKEVSSVGGQKVSYSHPFFWAPFVLVGKSN